ncbi:hypothetical protein CCM_00693 [Cordyceps militaris CM01]|uniref:Uncharacterized protein n=1 Tax=Cordyceps militaris (strain CM01) TaxID=983644 RepID=G3J5H7_CORMM|nr:uncharacterized protein CCM_00693 [Cordyceps militaris CM01]EGX96038.1 hypothetical protein CCM_00693 [Cordyceps militaris CM01]
MNSATVTLPFTAAQSGGAVVGGLCEGMPGHFALAADVHSMQMGLPGPGPGKSVSYGRFSA